MRLLSELNNLIPEAWVIKNQDGRERRFKDKDSADALAWKNSSSPKKEKVVAYTDEWWDTRVDRGFDGVTPDDRIDTYDSSDEIGALFKQTAGNWDINDLHVIARIPVKVDGTTCATATIRVSYEYDLKELGMPADDESITMHGNDGVGLESTTITVRRDRQNPSKLALVR